MDEDMDEVSFIIPPLKKQGKDRGKRREAIGQETGRFLQIVYIKGRFGEPEELGRTGDKRPYPVAHINSMAVMVSFFQYPKSTPYSQIIVSDQLIL